MFKNTHLKLDIKLDRDELIVLARALKDFKEQGKTVEQFQEDYGCTLIMDAMDYGIKDIKFHNASNKTAFMLKYNK